MSKEMYLMRRGFVGDTENDEISDYAHDSFEEALAINGLADDVEIYMSRPTDKPVRTRAIIQNDTTDNPEFASLRQILCRDGTNLQCGNYIKRDDGSWWIIPYLPGSNGMYEKSFIWYCNYVLKFISPLTGEMVEYPVSTENATRYNSGERETSKMLVGTTQHILYIPNNSETILINNGHRLLYDYNRTQPTAMRVTQVDTTSYAYGGQVRLLRWTLVEDQYNEQTDDAVSGVANLRPYGSIPGNEGSSIFG